MLAARSDAREYFEGLADVTHRLDSWPPADPPADLKQDILNALPRHRPKAAVRAALPPRRRWTVPALAFASGITVGLVMFLLILPYWPARQPELAELWGSMARQAATAPTETPPVLQVRQDDVEVIIHSEQKDGMLLARVKTFSNESIDLYIRYEGSALRYSGYLSLGENRTQSLNTVENQIHLSARGSSHFLLLFHPSGEGAPILRLELLRQNETLFQRDLSLMNGPAR
jgi:hypothetical protein